MLLKHTSYNLLGLGIPLIAAVVSIPMLIDALGTHRFGLLTLIWAVVSYFGLFDMGLGRALTQQLSVAFAQQENERIAPLVATASVLMACLGVFAGLLMAVLAPWGVGLIDGVPDQQEAINAVYFMSLGMPAVLLTTGFRGILDAKHAFGIANLIRLPMGLFTFLGPLAVVLYGQPRLDWIALVLVAGRLLACLVHAWYARRVLPYNRGPFKVQTNMIRPLAVAGGWLTVSNIISPFMGYVDRFLIGAIVSASAVAYYVTPQELVTKLWIVPGALTSVLFPTFAALMAQRDAQTEALFRKSVSWLFVALLPVTATIMVFANEILSLWISPEFASHSAVLLQIFAVGILANCLAFVPFSLIQSSGSPRLTAMIHTSELPIFIGVLWWLTSDYGVLGAAIAWLIRVVVDSLLMFYFGSSLLGRLSKPLMNVNTLVLAMLAVLAFSGFLFQSPLIRAIWIAVISLLVVWTKVSPSILNRANCKS